MEQDILPSEVLRNKPPQDEPKLPGFYKYAGGRSSLIFCLDYSGNWWAITDSPHMDRCVWGYIEQALRVETLVKI